jgi:tetratricopeptide (TPR) repeat protein
VQHSLDLDFQDEPLFLLASAHLQLGLLLQRQDDLIEAQQHLQQSLLYFPNYVAAHAALGQAGPVAAIAG